MLPMKSKKPDAAKPNISPVLFMTVDGEPMSFFLRPGPVKRKFQPLITAGAGVLCNLEQPGAILLIEPEERGIIPESSAHWFVSTQYILDCIEKDEQLNLEDYRFHPEVVPRQSARLNNKKVISTGGRVAYTAEEDAAILTYVSKHMTETGGNRLWQEMMKQGVTTHSWQSMKKHYQVLLAHRQSEVGDVATTEEDTKAAESETKEEGNQETDVQKNSSDEDSDSPQMDSTETDPIQIAALSAPPESTETEIVEAQTSIPPQEEEEEEQHVDPQADKQPDESTQVETVEAETCNSPQPEGSCLDPQTDAQPVSAESPEPETEEPQTIISPTKESVPEDSPPAEPKSLPDTSSQKKPKEKQKASPKMELPTRRFTRRQLVIEMSPLPEPYGKQLRSSSTSPGRLSLSPQPSKKTKSADNSNLQTDTTVDQPPSKRARGKSVAGRQQETAQAAVPEMAHADTETNSERQKGGKRKEKRKFGILEKAIKEFESDDDEDEGPDLQTETATIQPTSTLDTAADVDPMPSNPEHGPSPQENMQVAEASSSTALPKTGCPEPAANEAVDAPCEAHLFIFDSESQEESQSVIGFNPIPSSKPQPTMNKDAALSLTQVQLEEDKQHIKALMNQTNQDLVSVTKALLKTSGDFSAALDQLLNPSLISGPVWNRCDDGLLFSSDPVVRQQLQEKYSEEDVAKRIVFLEVDR